MNKKVLVVFSGSLNVPRGRGTAPTFNKSWLAGWNLDWLALLLSRVWAGPGKNRLKKNQQTEKMLHFYHDGVSDENMLNSITFSVA